MTDPKRKITLFFRNYLLIPGVVAIFYIFIEYVLTAYVNKFLIDREFTYKLLNVGHLSDRQRVQEYYYFSLKLRMWTPLFPGFLLAYLAKNTNWIKKIVLSFVSYAYSLFFISVFNIPFFVYFLLMSIVSLQAIYFLFTCCFGILIADLFIKKKYALSFFFLLIAFLIPFIIIILQTNPRSPFAPKFTSPKDELLNEIKNELLIPFCESGKDGIDEQDYRYFSLDFMHKMTSEGKQRFVDGKYQLVKGINNLQSNIEYYHNYLYRLDDGFTCEAIVTRTDTEAVKKRELLKLDNGDGDNIYYTYKPFSNVERNVWIVNEFGLWKFSHISGTN